MKKGITWSRLRAICWCEFGSSSIGTDEDWCLSNRSEFSSSCEGRSVIVFCGRAFWCRELCATNGADLTRSLYGGRVPGVGDGEDTECREAFGASPYERGFFDFLKSIIYHLVLHGETEIY